MNILTIENETVMSFWNVWHQLPSDVVAVSDNGDLNSNAAKVYKLLTIVVFYLCRTTQI